MTDKGTGKTAQAEPSLAIAPQASVPLAWFSGLEMALNTLEPTNDYQQGMMDAARALVSDARRYAAAPNGRSELVSSLSALSQASIASGTNHEG